MMKFHTRQNSWIPFHPSRGLLSYPPEKQPQWNGFYQELLDGARWRFCLIFKIINQHLFFALLSLSSRNSQETIMQALKRPKVSTVQLQQQQQSSQASTKRHQAAQNKWTHASALLYSITLITTIGETAEWTFHRYAYFIYTQQQR